MNAYSKTSLSTLLMAVLSSTTAIEALDPIPTMLVVADDPTDYPDPICSKCKIIVLDDGDDASASSSASVTITYPADVPGFTGAIGVTVWLESDERRTLWLDDVSLEPGDDVELVARAGSDWSWYEVRFVWLRFVPE